MRPLGPKTPSNQAVPCLCHCLLAAALGVQLALRLGVPDAGLHTWGIPGRVPHLALDGYGSVPPAQNSQQSQPPGRVSVHYYFSHLCLLHGKGGSWHRSPCCREHRCARPCFLRHSGLQAQPHRRAGVPGAESALAGRPGGSPASRSHPQCPAGPCCTEVTRSSGGLPPPWLCGTGGSALGGPCSWGNPQGPEVP